MTKSIKVTYICLGIIALCPVSAPSTGGRSSWTESDDPVKDSLNRILNDPFRVRRAVSDAQVPSICNHFEFECESGECLSYNYRCDGNSDCRDSSDEVHCHNNTCPDGHFRCANGHCVSMKYRCNGKPECSDNSDEDDCENSTCTGRYWRCDNGQCINIFARCDGGTSMYSGCNDNSDEENCDEYECVAPYSFKCNNGHCVFFATRCDNGTMAFKGCPDGSDEINCHNSSCPLPYFRCGTGQCLLFYMVCNGLKDCLDGSDENNCFNHSCSVDTFQCKSGQCAGSMFERCDGHSGRVVDCTDGSDEDHCLVSKCPDGYFQCRTGQCLKHNLCSRNNPVSCDVRTDPVDHCGKTRCASDYTECEDGTCLHHNHRCDGINDCRDQRETDERNCGIPDCRKDQVDCGDGLCIPKTLICDGYKHCRNGADEVCGFNSSAPCPKRQQCSQSDICLQPEQICDGIVQCPNSDDERGCLAECPENCTICLNGLIDCRRSDSRFQFANGTQYRLLPFKSIVASRYHHALVLLERIHSLLLSRNSLTTIPTDTFLYTPNLQTLNLSYNKITKVHSSDFHGLYRLSILDLSFNSIQTIEDFVFRGLRVANTILIGNSIRYFTRDLFSGMAADGNIYTDEYRFCCIRPNHIPEVNCYPHADQFSSCDDLMRDVTLRVMLWTVGTLALVGNSITVMLRLWKDKESLKTGYGLFVTNLSVADFLMGVYLLLIASVDEMFRGRYITEDEIWRKSVWCSFAGISCTVSSEASVLFISLITLDRYTVIKYPFGEYRIRKTFAWVLVAMMWCISLSIATAPLIVTDYFKNEFYSTSGVCIALPLTPDARTGWEYSVTIFLGLNFVLFLFICAGQFLIYYEILSTRRKCASRTLYKDDVKIAGRLMFVVMTDFCCWVPIGCLCIMALSGRVISPTIYAWVVIFVLPINSALNPFLYTFISKLC